MAPSKTQSFQYEFFGPWGPALLVPALPAVVLGLVWACNESGCLSLTPTPWAPGFPAGRSLYSHQAMAAVLGWFSLVLVLHLLLPGAHMQGVALPNRRRLTYKLNGVDFDQ